MHIVIDLDGTVVNDYGKDVRPGKREFIARLRLAGHEVSMWADSMRDRALRILEAHGLTGCFHVIVCREDYDADGHARDKDIRIINGDVLIDDDELEVRYITKIGRHGMLVPRFTNARLLPANECDGWWAWLMDADRGGRQR